MREDLIERLRSVQWDMVLDGDRAEDDPAAKCVFVDMRPDEFEALLNEAAAALEAAREDAERYRWLRDSKACSMGVSFNDHHNVYQSAQQTVECSEGYYNGIPEGELRRMIETDTIWTVHVYPRNPVGFDAFHGATLDAAIDQARGKGAKP